MPRTTTTHDATGSAASAAAATAGDCVASALAVMSLSSHSSSGMSDATSEEGVDASTEVQPNATAVPPPLTVLMAVYNTEHTILQEAIDSIRTQTLQEFEFLIVDDGSDKETKALLNHYAQIDPRIRLMTNLHNQGLVASLNKGLMATDAQLIARMDSDDVALPHRLQAQMDFLRDHENIDIVGSAVEVFRTEECPSPDTATTRRISSTVQLSPLTEAASTPCSPMTVLSTLSDRSSSASSGGVSSRVITHPISSGLVSWSMPFYCCLAHPATMYRREVIVDAGAYQPGWACAEDYELWLRLQRQGVNMANLPDVLLRLRKHGANVSSGARTRQLQSHHSLLAVQSHLSQVLRAPVGLEYARGLVYPSSMRSVGELHTLAHLLRALEAYTLQRVALEDHAHIRQDCTARLGELATLAMQMESAPHAAPPQRASSECTAPVGLTAAGTRSHTIAESFSLPADPSNASASSLMGVWMSRGADAAGLLSMLMRKSPKPS